MEPRRRQFRLPEADEEFLDRLGLAWETLVEGSLRWLILKAFPLPAGYGQTAVDVAIMIQLGYPAALVDSAYTCPVLARVDGRTIQNAQGRQLIDGRTWQFWSRHRTAANPWVAGEDDLGTHIHWMESWFGAELERA